jgi:FtsH-binding integral membrane protein
MYPYQGSYADARPYGAQLDVSEIMRRVYTLLALGLALGFGVAFALGQMALTATNNGTGSILFSPLAVIVALLAYLGIGFGFYPLVRRISLTAGTLLYFVFTVVFGFLIADIFVIYTPASIAAAFVTTAVMFGAMALIGYTTKLDLSRFGAILFMALIGLIIASLVNLFVASSALYWVVTYAGVLIFCGLTAYDVQWIKKQAVAVAGTGDELTVGRVALLGAFRLFLDFINLFLFLLRILGGRRS